MTVCLASKATEKQSTDVFGLLCQSSDPRLIFARRSGDSCLLFGDDSWAEYILNCVCHCPLVVTGGTATHYINEASRNPETAA